MDLLDHVVGVVALLHLLQLPGDAVHPLVHRAVLQVRHVIVPGREGHHFTVLEVHHLLGVGDHGTHIAGDEHLVLSHPQHHGGTVPGPDNLVRMVGMHHQDAEGALQQRNGRLGGGFEVALVEGFHQMGNHFRVGLGAEFMPLFHQTLLQPLVVLDDAVVADGDPAAAVPMGVGVGVGDTAVGGPAGVTDAPVTRNILRDNIFQGLYLAGFLPDIEGRLETDTDSRRIVPPVFKSLESGQQHVRRCPGSAVSDNSTHLLLPPEAVTGMTQS